MTMQSKNVVVTTPAGGGDISPAPAGSAHLQEVSSTADAAGVVEPTEPDEIPAASGSDEITVDEIFDFDIDELDPEDDIDEAAFPRSHHRIICSANSDGQVLVHRRGDTGLAFTADEARQVLEFLAETARVWGKALE